MPLTGGKAHRQEQTVDRGILNNALFNKPLKNGVHVLGKVRLSLSVLTNELVFDRLIPNFTALSSLNQHY